MEKYLKSLPLIIPLILAVFILRGYAANYATGTTKMEATVAATITGITPSAAVTAGIQFGTVDPNTFNNDAINNTGCGAGGSGTCYNFTIDPASNTNADIANAASGDLLKDGTGPQSIGIGNVTVAGNSTDPNGANLAPSSAQQLSTSFTTIAGCSGSNSIAPGGTCHTRYWLNVTLGQTAGYYNTTYCFCGIESGVDPSNCGNCQ